MIKRKFFTVAAGLMGLLALTACSGSHGVASGEEKVWVAYKTTPIVALAGAAGPQVSGGGTFLYSHLSSDNKVDYLFATVNGDGSFSEKYVSNLHVPDYPNKGRGENAFDPYYLHGVGPIRIFQDATPTTARIVQQYCTGPKGVEDCEGGNSRVEIHIPEGSITMGSFTANTGASKDATEDSTSEDNR